MSSAKPLGLPVSQKLPRTAPWVLGCSSGPLAGSWAGPRGCLSPGWLRGAPWVLGGSVGPRVPRGSLGPGWLLGAHGPGWPRGSWVASGLPGSWVPRGSLGPGWLLGARSWVAPWLRGSWVAPRGSLGPGWLLGAPWALGGSLGPKVLGGSSGLPGSWVLGCSSGLPGSWVASRGLKSRAAPRNSWVLGGSSGPRIVQMLTHNTADLRNASSNARKTPQK